MFRKKKDNPAIKVHKLEIEKLELQEKLKKSQSENAAFLVTLMMVLLLIAMVFLSN